MKAEDVQWRARTNEFSMHESRTKLTANEIRDESQRVLSLPFSIMRISLSRKYPEAICCIVFRHRRRVHAQHTQKPWCIFGYSYYFTPFRFGDSVSLLTMLFISIIFRQLRAQSFGFSLNKFFFLESVCRAMLLYSTSSRVNAEIIRGVAYDAFKWTRLPSQMAFKWAHAILQVVRKFTGERKKLSAMHNHNENSSQFEWNDFSFTVVVVGIVNN